MTKRANKGTPICLLIVSREAVDVTRQTPLKMGKHILHGEDSTPDAA